MLKLSHSCCCLFSLIPSILWEGKICLNKVLLSCACCQSRNLFSLLKILPKLCPLQLSLNWGQFYHGIFENLDRKINEIKKKKKTVKQYALIIMLYIDNRVKQKIVQSTWNHQKKYKNQEGYANSHDNNQTERQKPLSNWGTVAKKKPQEQKKSVWYQTAACDTWHVYNFSN